MSDLSGKYKVYLGGRERGLRYTADDAEALERKYTNPETGLPVGMVTLAGAIVNPQGARTVFHDLLHTGLKRVDSRIPREKAIAWYQDLVDKGDTGAIRSVRHAVYNAMGDSGIAGFKWPPISESDIDEDEAKEDPKAQPES